MILAENRPQKIQARTGREERSPIVGDEFSTDGTSPTSIPTPQSPLPLPFKIFSVWRLSRRPPTPLQTELFTMGKIGQDDDAEGGVPSVDDDEEAYAETDALLGSGDRASEKRGKEEEEAWARAGSLGREGGGVDLDRLSIEDDASFDGEMGLQSLSVSKRAGYERCRGKP